MPSSAVLLGGTLGSKAQMEPALGYLEVHGLAMARAAPTSSYVSMAAIRQALGYVQPNATKRTLLHE